MNEFLSVLCLKHKYEVEDGSVKIAEDCWKSSLMHSGILKQIPSKFSPDVTS